MPIATFGPLRYTGILSLLAAAYFFTAKAGLVFAIPPGNATAVWAPSGIALAAVLLLGYRVWPAVSLGSLIVNLTTGVSLPTAVAFATGNTLEAVVGAWLIHYFLPLDTVFSRATDAFRFAGAAAASCVIAASVGAMSLVVGGYMEWSLFAPNWVTWWLGDVAGQMIVAPLVLAFTAKMWRTRSTRQAIELVSYLVVLIGASQCIFGGWLPEQYAEKLLYVTVILLIWVALRFSLVEVTVGTAILTLAAISGVCLGVGAYGTEAIRQSLFDVQIFMNIYALTGLALASMVATRRAAETALRQSHDELKQQVVERSRAEMRFRQLLKSAPDAMIISKGDGTIMLANEAAERIFGYSSDELVGQAIELLVPARHRERHREHRKRYSDSPFVRMMGTGVELTARRKDGSEFPAEISLGPMRTDEGLFVFSAVRDVTARKLAETALRESQERFDLAVRGTDAGIWDWDLRTDTVYFSPRWKSMLGYAEHEIPDSFAEWKTRIHPEDLERSTATVRDYLEGSSPDYELEHRLRHRDGSYRWILARGAVVRDREGKPYRMVGSHIDITDFKRAQDVIISQQAQFVAAEEIQQLLLPQDNPKLPGFEVGGKCYPAEFAAGDYFDYLCLPDQSFVVVVGDVAGHGIGPALLMAWLHAHLSLLSESHTDLSEIVTRANSALFRETGGERFVTLIAGRIDPQTRTLSCVSGGHPPGYVLNCAGEVKHRLKGNSLALGILPDVQYPISDPVEIADGDIVVFLTDGILEAASLDDQPFGIDACIQTIHSHRDQPAMEIIRHLHSAVCRHTAKEHLDDDITLVIVKVGSVPQQARGQDGPG